MTPRPYRPGVDDVHKLSGRTDDALEAMIDYYREMRGIEVDQMDFMERVAYDLPVTTMVQSHSRSLIDSLRSRIFHYDGLIRELEDLLAQQRAKAVV